MTWYWVATCLVYRYVRLFWLLNLEQQLLDKNLSGFFPKTCPLNLSPLSLSSSSLCFKASGGFSGAASPANPHRISCPDPDLNPDPDFADRVPKGH